MINEDVYNKWQRAVHTGVGKVVERIGNTSKRLLNEQKDTGVEEPFETIKNSWYNKSEDINTINFGYEHPRATAIEYGETVGAREEVVVEEKERRTLERAPGRRFIHGEEVRTEAGKKMIPEERKIEPRPFLHSAVVEEEGIRSALTIIEHVEESFRG